VLRFREYSPHLSTLFLHFFREDGKYRLTSTDKASTDKELPVAHVWFSHSLIEGRPSTYIINDCPEKSKETILSFAEGANTQTLLRPLTIDAFLSDQCLHEWRQELFVPRQDLMEFVCQSSIDRKFAEDFLPISERKNIRIQNFLQPKLKRTLNVFILSLGFCI